MRISNIVFKINVFIFKNSRFLIKMLLIFHFLILLINVF